MISCSYRWQFPYLYRRHFPCWYRTQFPFCYRKQFASCSRRQFQCPFPKHCLLVVTSEEKSDLWLWKLCLHHADPKIMFSPHKRQNALAWIWQRHKSPRKENLIPRPVTRNKIKKKKHLVNRTHFGDEDTSALIPTTHAATNRKIEVAPISHNGETKFSPEFMVLRAVNLRLVYPSFTCQLPRFEHWKLHL